LAEGLGGWRGRRGLEVETWAELLSALVSPAPQLSLRWNDAIGAQVNN